MGLANHSQTQMTFLSSFIRWLKRLCLPAQTPLFMRTCWVPTLSLPRLAEPGSFSVSCVTTDVLLRHIFRLTKYYVKSPSLGGGGRNAHLSVK